MIEVREIFKKKDIKKFVNFPCKLYHDNKYYVPAMYGDELSLLDKTKNPAYEYCETRFFLAYEDGKIVGRICGLINHAANKKTGLKQIRFCRYDVIDNLEVSRLLFNEVINWAKERGLNSMIGPIGFSDMDKQGLLVEGFEEHSNIITLYNHPYYMKHLEALGLKKDADWLEFQVFTPKSLGERMERLSEAIRKRYGYKIVKLQSKKEIKPYILTAFDIINESFEPLYGVVPLNKAQINLALKQFATLVNMEFLYLVTSKEDELIGFGLLVPSLSAVSKKSNGRLFPLGWIRALRALKKCKVLDMTLIAVKPKYHGLGVNALILSEGIKSAIKNGVEYAETGPELETNEKIISQWQDFETRQHRRRRCYKIDF